MHHPGIEWLFQFRAIQWLAASVFIVRGACRWALGHRYQAVADFSWIVRVTASSPIRTLAKAIVLDTIRSTSTQSGNLLVDYYLADPESRHVADRYAVSGHGTKDLWRDFIVLKGWRDGEKGVILLKYGQTFNATVAIFDLQRLMDRYVFVLEPSWAGYCDPGLLLFHFVGQPVVVQCFTTDDHELIRSIGRPLIPVRLGPADWVDSDVFGQESTPSKHYDLVMVANWSSIKRHSVLFRALRDLGNRNIRVLLIGFPWGGRSADDIRRDARRWLPASVSLEILESVPHHQLAGLLRRCKAFVFLSKKEGDNKSLVEAMFADVPAIVYDLSVGGAVGRINVETGILSSERELPEKIIYMLDNYTKFSPRRWALKNTGSRIATKLLNDALRSLASAEGRAYTIDIAEKVNSPNLAYKNEADRARFAADYRYICDCRRQQEQDAVIAHRRKI